MLLYSEVNESDFEQMLILYERFLNAGENIAPYLREGISDSSYAGVKCMDGERMIGVFSARPGVDFTCGHEDIAEKIRRRWRSYRLFTADMLAVLPEYRGLGVARRLAEGLRASLKARGCERLVIEEWRRSIEGDVPVSGVLKYIGPHTTLGVYPDFYRDSAEYGVTCPECGPHCRCGALVCILEIH